MKRFFIPLFFLLTVSNIGLAQQLKAYLSYSRFFSPDEKPYLETYLTIIGSSLQYVESENGKFIGEAEITFTFSQNNEIKFSDKYTLQSPALDSIHHLKANLIDQQRIVLPNGMYDFGISIQDKHSEENPFKASQSLVIDFPRNIVSISDIQLVESYSESKSQNILTKSGYDLIPYSNNYYPEGMDNLIFYGEVYNTITLLGDDVQFLVNCFVENADNGQVAANLRKFSKNTTKNVNVIFQEFPIDKLTSGNYNIVIEVRDRENNLLASKRSFFQRSGPQKELELDDLTNLSVDHTFVQNVKSAEEMADYIKSTLPISTNLEKVFAENQLNYSDLEMMKKYFYNFWHTRNTSDPEAEWVAYYEEVKLVNAAYGTSISKGYETARGRVYLRYGKPNTINQSVNEPSSFPYEIWHYYNIEASLINNRQSDRRFVFYNTDLASNNYQLLHSDAQGELRNDRWQVELQNRTDQFYNLDTEQGVQHYGGRSDDYFERPR